MNDSSIIPLFQVIFSISLLGGSLKVLRRPPKISEEIKRLQDEYDAQAYARSRQAEYPDYGTQLNKIYDDGLTKWKSEMVDPIKAKYPKPE